MTREPAPVIYADDKRQVERLLAGDESAFRRFFDDHYARLHRFALARLSRVGGDHDAAADVVQITLSKALQRLPTYRGEAQLFTWLCAIGRFEIADWARLRARDASRFVLTEDSPEVQAAVDSIPSTEGDPEKELQHFEAQRLIQVALDRLPPRYGDALEWKYIEGYSAHEIAQRLGVGVDAANSLLARAKRAFKEVYGALLQAGADPHSPSEAR
jgi:RNA polymerase sigma-70 factor, ECF subfamily